MELAPKRSHYELLWLSQRMYPVYALAFAKPGSKEQLSANKEGRKATPAAVV